MERQKSVTPLSIELIEVNNLLMQIALKLIVNIDIALPVALVINGLGIKNIIIPILPFRNELKDILATNVNVLVVMMLFHWPTIHYDSKCFYFACSFLHRCWHGFLSRCRVPGEEQDQDKHWRILL